jgi:hypothetical protein
MSKYVTQQEEADYGPEFLDVVRRKAQETTENLQAQVNHLQNQLHRNSRGTMKDYLSRTIPNWEQVNESDQFLAWLDQVDGYSAQKRLTLLRQAWASNDVTRVARFFNDFLTGGSNGAPDPRQGGYSQSNHPQGQIMSKEFIRQFYDPRQRNRYTPEQRQQIEQEIVRAGRENRIRGR